MPLTIPEGSQQVVTRLPKSVVARIEKHRERLRREVGAEMTRTNAVASLISKGLEAVEGAAEHRK